MFPQIIFYFLCVCPALRHGIDFFSKLKIFFVKKTCLKFCIQIKKCLGKNETEWIMRTNLGKLNYEGINCGELSLDEYPVHVGSSVLSGQLCTGKNLLP